MHRQTITENNYEKVQSQRCFSLAESRWVGIDIDEGQSPPIQAPQQERQGDGQRPRSRCAEPICPKQHLETGRVEITTRLPLKQRV